MICSSCRSALRLRLRLPSSLPARPSIAPIITNSFKSTAARTSSQPSFRSISSTSTRQFSSSSQQQPQQDAETETDADTGMTPAESSIAAILASKLHPTSLLVQDISGGCGSMYAIDITSSAFRGLGMLKQQRLVNGALGDLVREWHGVQIRTRVPPEDA